MTRLVGCVLVLAAACGDGAAPEGPPPGLRDDARTILEVASDDPTVGALEEVDDAVLENLPTRAAELLERGAIPAARRQAERLDRLEVSTPEGRRLHRRLLEAYRDRTEALEAYRESLRRGEVEDLRLVEAMGAQREAETEIAALMAELEGLLQAR